MSMQTEPARIIGVITAVVIAVVQTLIGQGVLSSNVGTSVINILGVLLPIILAEIIRRFVSSPATVAALTSSSSSGVTNAPK